VTVDDVFEVVEPAKLEICSMVVDVELELPFMIAAPKIMIPIATSAYT